MWKGIRKLECVRALLFFLCAFFAGSVAGTGVQATSDVQFLPVRQVLSEEVNLISVALGDFNKDGFPDLVAP